MYSVEHGVSFQSILAEALDDWMRRRNLGSFRVEGEAK
jgi:hypothetical protein